MSATPPCRTAPSATPTSSAACSATTAAATPSRGCCRSRRPSPAALLAANRHLVEALRDALLEREELVGNEITDVLEAAAAAPRVDRPDRRGRPARPRLDAGLPRSARPGRRSPRPGRRDAPGRLAACTRRAAAARRLAGRPRSAGGYALVLVLTVLLAAVGGVPRAVPRLGGTLGAGVLGCSRWSATSLLGAAGGALHGRRARRPRAACGSCVAFTLGEPRGRGRPRRRRAAPRGLVFLLRRAPSRSGRWRTARAPAPARAPELPSAPGAPRRPPAWRPRAAAEPSSSSCAWAAAATRCRWRRRRGRPARRR